MPRRRHIPAPSDADLAPFGIVRDPKTMQMVPRSRRFGWEDVAALIWLLIGAVIVVLAVIVAWYFLLLMVAAMLLSGFTGRRRR